MNTKNSNASNKQREPGCLGPSAYELLINGADVKDLVGREFVWKTTYMGSLCDKDLGGVVMVGKSVEGKRLLCHIYAATGKQREFRLDTMKFAEWARKTFILEDYEYEEL